MLDIMSADGKLEEMQNELRCSICCDLFVQASTLSCSHSFCLNCINAWKQRHSDCPICRQTITSMTPSRALDNMVATFQNGVPREPSVPAVCRDSTPETVPPNVLSDLMILGTSVETFSHLSSSDIEISSSPEPENYNESQTDCDDVSNGSSDDVSYVDADEDHASEEEDDDDDDPVTVSEGSYSAAEGDYDGEDDCDSNEDDGDSNEEDCDEEEGYMNSDEEFVIFAEHLWGSAVEIFDYYDSDIYGGSDYDELD